MTSMHQNHFNTLEAYIKNNRFNGTVYLENILKAFSNYYERRLENPSVILIHSQYPQPNLDDQPITELTDEELILMSGLGAGKSDLVELATEEIRKQHGVLLISFKDVRNSSALEGKEFYKDVFLSRINELEPFFFYSRKERVLNFISVCWSRLALLVDSAFGSLLSFVVALITTIFGSKLAEFVAAPQNQNFLEKTAWWLANNPNVILAVGLPIIFILWPLYSWGKIQRNKDLLDKWKSSGPKHKEMETIEQNKEELRSQPERLLQRLCVGSRVLVFAIDDVDTLDSDSFQNLLKLHDYSLENHKWPLFLLLSYNPSSPALQKNSRLMIKRELDYRRIKEKGWLNVEVEPVNGKKITSLLWGYYKSDVGERFQRILETSFVEARENPGLLLSFFVLLDKQKKGEALNALSKEDLLQEFEKYLNWDRCAAEDILMVIQDCSGPDFQGCQEVLKFILAFKMAHYPIKSTYIGSLLKQTPYPDFEKYLSILQSQKLELIRETTIDQERTLDFQKPYVYSMLNTGWVDWRNTSFRYYTYVFSFLHAKVKEDNPKLALMANSSKLSIHTLWCAGEYYFHFAGASDAGTALAYYGLDKGGALAKCLELYHGLDGNLWQFMHLNRWSPSDISKFKPYKNWYGGIYSVSNLYGHDLILPLLILMAGRIYWIIGEVNKAYSLWTERWPQIADRLAHEEATSADDLDSLRKADVQIKSALAEMLYCLGRSGSWNEAKQVCQAILQNPNHKPGEKELANMVHALIQHYQSASVGNWLPPYRFLRPEFSFDHISNALKQMSAINIARLRLLHTQADAQLQIMKLDLPSIDHITHLSKTDASLLYQKKKGDNALREPEIYFCLNEEVFSKFVQTIQSMNETIGVVNASRSKKNRRLLSGGRFEEGELLLWEGYALLYLREFFRLEVTRLGVMDKTILTNNATSKTRERINVWYSLIGNMRNLCTQYLPDHRMPPEFATLDSEVEALYQRIGQNERNNLKKEESEIAKKADLMYQAASTRFIEAAREKFHLAETIFRYLNIQQGISSVAYARMETALIENKVIAFGNYPAWLAEFERFAYLFTNELGYHLDALLAFIRVGHWSSIHNIPRAIENYLAALKWASENSLGLPASLEGELNFQVGNMIGNLEKSPYPYDMVEEKFKSAGKILNAIEQDPPYISSNAIFERRLSIAWWLSEIYYREAARQTDRQKRNALLEKSIAEANRVISRGRRREDREYEINQAREVKGRSLVAQGKVFEGFLEMETAANYFVSIRDLFNGCQSLTHLVGVGLYDTSSNPNWVSCEDRAIKKHIPKLLEFGTAYKNAVPSLNYTQRTVFIRTGHLIARICRNNSRPPQTKEALEWYKTVFEVYESLGMYGSAVELTREMRDCYAGIGDYVGLDIHLRQVLIDLQRLDPKHDILPGYDSIQIVVQELKIRSPYVLSEHLQNKQELLTTAEHACNAEPPDFASAIQHLEKARQDIDLDHPEEIDRQILNILRRLFLTCCEDDQEKIEQLEGDLNHLNAAFQCSEYLALARYFKSKGMQYRVFLDIAASAVDLYPQLNTQEVNEARFELNAYPLEAVEAAAAGEGDPIRISSEQEGKGELITSEAQLEQLLTKPIAEFTPADCSTLLNLLENGLREHVAGELRKVTTKWWKQRIPQEIRNRAEERKKDRENNYPGLVSQNLPIYMYLDFTDLATIITMRTNWEEVFHNTFKRSDHVTVKLGEISPLRNDIAHNRGIHPHDRELFITTARQFIRVIQQSRSNVTEESTGELE